MKVVIATVQAPFVSGGAEVLANNLNDAFKTAGHDVSIVTMPFMDEPIELIENHIIAARLLNLEKSWAGKVDLCVGLKFPAYFIPHSNKVIWTLHQHRAAYEMFNTEFSNLKDDARGRHIRQVVINSDQRYLGEAKRIYTISKNVSRRMKEYSHISSMHLYPPCPDMDKFYSKEYGDYILMPSRINITKRQLLALEAMTKTKSDIKLYIMGRADNICEKERMLHFIKKHKLQNKVKYFDFVSQEEKFELYASARAILFIPVDEDYGYISLEAMAASKAVITATDSGGPLEFIENGRNGYTVEPDSQNIAEAFDEIGKSKNIAKELGAKARKHLIEMDITWDRVIKELTK